MGLDMYLYKKKFIWNKESETIKITGVKGITPEKVRYITEEAMYWRKANAIHKWFVDNVQKGEDDCGSYPVGKDKLEELYKLALFVVRNPKKAKEVLPLTEGFFFGGTKYDEYYFNDLKRTAEEIKKLLDNKDVVDWEFEYSSSW